MGMEKTQVEVAVSMDETSSQIPSFKGRKWKSRLRSRWLKLPQMSWRGRTTQGRGRHLLFPAALATVTGVLLGVCLLVLFKGQEARPTVTTVPAPKTQPGMTAQGSVPQSAVTVQGQTLFAWQVGSFGDRGAAEKMQGELQGKGVQTSIRGTGPFQLFAGVAADKPAGKPIEGELQSLGVAFYAKEFRIAPKQGGVEGLKEAEAKALGGYLDKVGQLAGELLPLGVAATTDAAQAKSVQERIKALEPEQKQLQAALQAAGQKEAAGALEALQQKLSQAADRVAGGGKLLEVQAKLTAFYVQYEAVIGQLVKAM
jgi:hypothetical protein